jgi:hypothetical protein
MRPRIVLAVLVVVLVAAACGGATIQGPPAESAPDTVAPPSPTPGLPSMLPGPAAQAPSATFTIERAGGSATAAPAPIVSSSRATTPPRASQLDPSARRRPFAIDLYRRGDFVSQARVDWCVPAAIQTMAHLIDRHANGSLPGQRVLDRRSRALSSSRLIGLGSEPQGWARVLNGLGDGRYLVVAKRSFGDAIAAAARALRLTGRPVGLLVWRGAHAWVMSGFEATADPARSSDFRVTRVRLIDPWYPRRLSAWGWTRPPDARIGVAALARSFVPWHRPTVRYAELDGRYVLVLPVPAAAGG